MNLFKKVWTRNGKKSTSKKWYISIDKKHVPLSVNKKIAEDLAAQLLGKRAAGDLNLKTRNDDQTRKPLPPFVNEWVEALETKGSSKKHVSLLKTFVKRVLDGCEFSRARNFDAEKVLRFVSVLTVGTEEKTRAASLQTKNFHLAALKQFARWLVKRGVIATNPFADLEGWNVKLDRKHDRRELSDEEIEKLLTTTEEKGEPRRQLSAADRSMLYLVAISTGLRASELASLTPESFDLSAATVTVQAGYTKNRALAVQPIPPALLPSLASWLSIKPKNEPCWPGTWAKVKAAGKMLQADLKAAKVPYEVDGRFADFHSLRHSYISRLVRSGVNPRLAQSLARHSTITLTMDRYAHVGQREREAAVAGFQVPGCKQDASGSLETAKPQEKQAISQPGTRLENRRAMSLAGSNPAPSAQAISHKPLQNKATANPAEREQFGCKPDLYGIPPALLRAWPQVLEHITLAIMALVEPYCSLRSGAQIRCYRVSLRGAQSLSVGRGSEFGRQAVLGS